MVLCLLAQQLHHYYLIGNRNRIERAILCGAKQQQKKIVKLKRIGFDLAYFFHFIAFKKKKESVFSIALFLC